ncbi:MAG: pantoate--beta-alanine ligase [Planctomycetota bacterium]
MTWIAYHHPEHAAAWCATQREQGRSIGFVPTMGALHEGHLSLVRAAAAQNDVVCVSIFVNPLQFGEARDFQDYRRDFEGDCELLHQAGAHMAFTGELAQFFPGRLKADGDLHPEFLEDPGPSAEGLEGAFRPGHFAGVATIVRRLFEIVGATRAYFGAKDYQQTLVVRDLAARLGGPEIHVCPTLREDSGLARSSRNERLSPEHRARAMFVSRALYAAQALWNLGERHPDVLSEMMRAVLALGDLEVEYAAVRDPRHFQSGPISHPLHHAVALIAARVGDVRLIDNMELSIPPVPSEPEAPGPLPFGAGIA